MPDDRSLQPRRAMRAIAERHALMLEQLLDAAEAVVDRNEATTPEGYNRLARLRIEVEKHRPRPDRPTGA